MNKLRKIDMTAFDEFWNRIEFLSSVIELNVTGFSLRDNCEITPEQAAKELQQLLN